MTALLWTLQIIYTWQFGQIHTWATSNISSFTKKCYYEKNILLLIISKVWVIRQRLVL